MNGGLVFESPWFLVLLPVAVAFAIWIQRTPRHHLSPWRQKTVCVLRPLSLSLLALVLADPQWERREEKLTVIFAVDASRSVGGASHPETLRWLAEAAEARTEGDRAGVVVFGRGAMIDRFPSEDFRGSAALARPGDDATDLGAALRLARGLFPPSHEARLVIVSDGVETRGSVEQAAAALGTGVDVVWARIPVVDTAEVLVEQISVPERVVEGEPHRVRVVVRSSRDTVAELKLFRGSVPLSASRIELQAGETQVYSFDQVAPPGAGALLYRAQVSSLEDATPENNAAAALVQVSGRPAVLVVDHEPTAIRPLARALEATGMRVKVGGPGILPTDVRGLAAYNALVLSDAGADHFSPAQLRAVASWVEDLGGGLVMLGGPEGFGRGGYWQTPIEDVLPLSMEVKDRSYFPSVGLVIAIDKSGSMMGSDAGGIDGTKMEVAKAATAEVVELLEPMDQIGIIAFDAAAKWLVPMTPGRDKDNILDQLGFLQAGGGTDAYPAMKMALETLGSTEARVKHVILVTDGQIAGRDHEGLAADMLDEDITISTVGIGNDADGYTLETIATAGGGTFYLARDLAEIPEIFLRDAFRVARSWTVEETFQPRRLGFHPVLSGVDALPPLDGYVATSEKPGAEHLLSTHLDDPLLSLWRVGLGKSVAFTSDAKARWAGAWLGWPGYEPFWAGLVRWSARDPVGGKLRASAVTSAGKLHVAADLLDDDGAFVNGARMKARVVGPGGKMREVVLEQDGPGRYKGEMAVEEAGPYLAAVLRDDERPGAVREAALTSAVVPYADEFRGLSQAPDALERLVSAGRVRELEASEEIFRHLGTGGSTRFSLAPALLALVAFLLVGEVAVRRLAAPEWLERWWKGEKKKAVQSDERLGALQAARRRVGRRREPELPVESDRPVEPERPAAAPTPVTDAPVTPAVEVVKEPTKEPPGPEGDGGYASRLRKAKRRSRRRR